MNDLVLIDSCCELTKTSLRFKGEVTKDQWGKVFSGLKTIEGCVQFWLGDALKYREQKWGMWEDVVKNSGYGESTLRQMVTTAKQIESDDRSSDLSYRHHIEVASLDSEKQKKYLKEAEKNDWSVKELREAVKSEKYKPVALPAGKFKVIYADPPWQFDNSGLNESADSKYKTMSTAEICVMAIRGLSTPDTVLFMWATNAMLEDALLVADAWGFNYKSNIVWAKNKGPSIGWFVQSRHELLLICTGSNNTHPLVKPVSWFEADVRAHSQKPDEVYLIIEKMYKGPYVELFGRNERKGWEVFGNEVSKSC